LESLRDGGWISPGAVIVLEERASADVKLPLCYTELDRRTWGDTQVVFGRID
jgi:16S rRNA (guanine966-N2)-methyltransferase